MKYAPIVLFVYNRPEHTLKTLVSLHRNDLAKESILYIYADGPKDTIDFVTKQNIEKTRDCIKIKKWCKEVFIIERSTNLGLAQSIISGVTDIINKHGKIIVLEDDLVTARGFLRFLNDALDTYESENQVMHISGYMYPLSQKLPTTFFYRQTSCWGWATWASRWKHLETSPEKLLFELTQSNKIEAADIDGTHQFIKQLKANIEGNLKTWAVLWHFSVFLKDGLCLHPGISLVKNIGMDNSGENCIKTKKFEVKLQNQVSVKKIVVEDHVEVYDYLRKFQNPKINIRIDARIMKLLRRYSPGYVWRKFNDVIKAKK